MARKAKYSYRVLKCGAYAIQRSGRTIARTSTRAGVEIFLKAYVGLDELPDTWKTKRMFYN